MFLGSTATIHFSFISNSGEILDVLNYQINVGMNFALNLKMFRAIGLKSNFRKFHGGWSMGAFYDFLFLCQEIIFKQL